jgi:hypothetical protein
MALIDDRGLRSKKTVKVGACVIEYKQPLIQWPLASADGDCYFAAFVCSGHA